MCSLIRPLGLFALGVFFFFLWRKMKNWGKNFWIIENDKLRFNLGKIYDG